MRVFFFRSWAFHEYFSNQCSLSNSADPFQYAVACCDIEQLPRMKTWFERIAVHIFIKYLPICFRENFKNEQYVYTLDFYICCALSIRHLTHSQTVFKRILIFGENHNFASFYVKLLLLLCTPFRRICLNCNNGMEC